MSRSITFKLLKISNLILDRCITFFFGGRFRQKYIKLSYKVKNKLFPQYGSYIPSNSAIGPTPARLEWTQPEIPDWVIDEMKQLAANIDPVLYPSDGFLVDCTYYKFQINPKPGEIYRKILSNCSFDYYTHCFAIPWLKRGGADFVTLKHIEVLARIKSCKILILMTEPGESPWKDRIPNNIDVVDVSKFAMDVSRDEYLLIIVRLLVQLKIDNIHIINSRHVWEIVCRYGLAVRQKTKIFASIYCDDFDKYEQPVGFAREFLPQCHSHLSAIFTDNTAFPRLLCNTYGYDPELFRVLKSPVDILHSNSIERKPHGRRVMWAGRLDRQKRPDLLLRIAQAMPDVEFHVYGDAVLEGRSGVVQRISKLPNVRMLGAFDGVESLPFSDFPVFLYTSQWDGTPTMVIAAALASIPVVASCVGGVGDIVTEKHGYPVSNIEDISSYVEKINQVLSNADTAEEKAIFAREYVLNNHSNSVFAKSLLEVPGYIS